MIWDEIMNEMLDISIEIKELTDSLDHLIIVYNNLHEEDDVKVVVELIKRVKTKLIQKTKKYNENLEKFGQFYW